MTCIVGLLDNGSIYMGADSAGVNGLNLRVRADRKVFTNGPFLMGYTSSFRMGQLLRYKFTPPPHPFTEEGKPIDAFEYMATSFVDEIRNCFKSGGYAAKDSERESGGTFLIGYRGRLFTIYDDYQVAETVDDFSAVGCGEEYALGSLYSTQGLPPEERIREALEVAERYSAGVRRPFHVIKSKNHVFENEKNVI